MYGYSPGKPIGSSGPPIPSGRSASVYSGRIGSPDIVENGASRSGARENVSLSQRSASVVLGRVAMASKSRCDRNYAALSCVFTG